MSFQLPDINQALQNKLIRKDKGLRMFFYADFVIKAYQDEPQLISKQEQTQRYNAEVSAYLHFNELACPFVPELHDHSPADQWLLIERISGNTIFELSQLKTPKLPVSPLIKKLDEINVWLRLNQFPDLGSNFKDIIQSKTDQLFIIDFESYGSENEILKQADLYNNLIHDLLDRILIGKGRKARYTANFVRLSLAVFIHSPFRTLYIASKLISSEVRHTLLVIKARAKRIIKTSLPFLILYRHRNK